MLVAAVVAAVGIASALAASPQFVEPSAHGTVTRTVDGVRFSLTVRARAWENGPHERIGRKFRTHGLLITKSTRRGQAAEAMIFWAGFQPGGKVTPCGDALTVAADRSSAALAEVVASAPGTKLAGGPWSVSLGGRPARRVVVRVVQHDLGCEPGFFFTWPHDPDRFNWGAFWPGMEVGDSIRVWIVDVRGKRLFLAAVTKPGHGIEQEIVEIVKSIRFG